MAVYLITGASSGIGEQLSRQACKNGHTVYGIARRIDLLKKLEKELDGRFIPIACDVADAEAVQAVVESLKDLPDIAILNAGVGDFDSRRKIDSAMHAKTFAVNYFGVMHFISALFPAFVSRGSGTFVATSSMAGYRGLPNAAAYCASKAAISVAMESMRCTYRKQGIRFVTIHPGFVDTPMTQVNSTPMPFLWSAEKAAHHILHKIDRGCWHINFPLPIWVAMWIARVIPAGLYRRIMR